MINLENYKPNVDVNDIYNIKNDFIGRNKNCSLKHVQIIRRRVEGVIDTIEYNKPLVAAVLGINNCEVDSFMTKKPEVTNTWTDVDAKQLYLKTDPNNYLILGKPGSCSYTLGEMIAEERKCVHICPRTVLLNEIEQKSDTGKCLDFNLRHYKEVKFDTLLPLIKDKLKSPIVQHRGYVLSGFPLVSSEMGDMWFFKQLHSEEAVLAAEEFLNDLLSKIKKSKKRKKRTSQSSRSTNFEADEEGTEDDEEEEEEELLPEEELEEEEDPDIELPKCLLEPSKNVIFSKRSYFQCKKLVMLNQLNELLDLSSKPTFIVYITIPDLDLILKRLNKFLDYATTSHVIEPMPTRAFNEVRWPPKYHMKFPRKDQAKPEYRKYKVRQPIHFNSRAVEQVCNYRNHILPYWERRYKDIDPKLIIKVDGRSTPEEMIYEVKEKTVMLPHLKKVLTPQPLNLDPLPEDLEDFWNEVKEVEVVKNEGGVAFNYLPSTWNNRCPVELSKRRTIIGKPKYAMKLFKHIYLLSSLDSLISFYKNPRPYLKIGALEPVCRIIITGTKSSGKTMIAECLAWLFDSDIISYGDIYNAEKEKKIKSYSENILSEIIPVIEDARIQNWEKVEAQRVTDLETWHNSALTSLKKYISFLSEYENVMSTVEEDERNKFLRNFAKIKDKIRFLPFLDDLEQCKSFLTSRNIMEFAPAKLTIVQERPSIPILGDPDVTEAISAYIIANDLQKEIDPSQEEMMGIIIEMLKNKDNTSLEAFSTYSKFIIDGFPPHPDYWAVLSEWKLLPDHTITIMENRDISQELLLHYTNIDKAVKNHGETFSQSTEPLIQLKMNSCPYYFRSKVYEQTVNEIVWEIINSIQIPDENPDPDETNKIAALTGSIESFREDWDNAKLKLEEDNKLYIEIEIDTKSDIDILEEALLHLRRNYTSFCSRIEEEDVASLPENEDNDVKDWTTYNDQQWLGETGIYCPIAYFDHGVLWEGKPELCLNFNNLFNYFSKEECLERFQKDPTKYQFFCKPYKKNPCWKICVMGCVGTGKTTLSKFIARELGLLHVDFEEALNCYMMPRHFKKVGRRYENIFTDESLDDEAVVEFAMDEDNERDMSDITYNENEIRRMIYNYLERGTPILSSLVQKLLKKLWRARPFDTEGFVLDGFPRIPQDVEEMVTDFCIPDVILELECDADKAIERVLPVMFSQWKAQQNEAKRKAVLQMNKQKQEWFDFITEKVVVTVIYNDIITAVMIAVEGPITEMSNLSTIMDADPTGPANLDEGIFNTYHEILEQYPAPENETEWEKNDDAKERIETRLSAIYESEAENFENLRETLAEQRIKHISLNASKSFNKVSRKALFNLSPLRNRKIGIFEHTHIISLETAVVLLNEGFYFLSRFSRFCPVYIFENPTTIFNPYSISLNNGTITPVIHRSYIYFIHTKESVGKFRMNPLLYITCDNILKYLSHSLRISLIGPPKSGKSTLAARFAKEYGLICVSRGKAIRRVLYHLPWTNLAKKMDKTLREGKMIDYEDIIKCVHCVVLDHRTNQYGFVLEGFPEYPPIAIELEKQSIYPMFVFDIDCADETLLEHHRQEEHLEILKQNPPYSESFLKYRLSNWRKNAYKIREYINNDAQNIYVINGNQGRWACFREAQKHIQRVSPEIHHFISNVKTDLVLPAGIMVIKDKAFHKKCSDKFLNFCPICLSKKYLRHSNEPVDRKGIVQYKGLFYWVCPEHMDTAINQPQKYFMANLTIPDLPARIERYDPTMVYENGYCVVTYAEKLPCQIIVPGKSQFAAMYKKHAYLFCGERCLRKFLARPHLYYDIIIFKKTENFPKLDLRKLPNIGYLEQTVANLLTEACCAVNVVRPKYPGLDMKVSALLFIGLYLKIKNPKLDKDMYPLYKKAYDIYETRSKFILNLSARIRSMDNPFVKYPECCELGADDDAVLRMLDLDRQAAIMKAATAGASGQVDPLQREQSLQKRTFSMMMRGTSSIHSLASIVNLSRKHIYEDDEDV